LIFLHYVLLLCGAILGLSSFASASTFENHHITIIGEIHHHSNSTVWFLKEVSEHVGESKCLNVALEIGSDQQDTINKVLHAGIPVGDIHISSVIDHKSYRDMLSDFRKIINNGKCLNIYAIDAPQNIKINRDQWMLKQIKIIDEESIPMAILIGNLHALKEVKWYPYVHGEPFLAARLQSDGFDVFSIIQHWPEGNCKTRSAKYDEDVQSALHSVLEPVAAYRPKTPSNVVNAALRWECVR